VHSQIRALVKIMVNMYMGDKMTSTEHTLAVTLGHPAHTRHGEDVEGEAQRRMRDTYEKIFPESNPSDANCPGHKVCRVSSDAALAQSVAMKSCAIFLCKVSFGPSSVFIN
jgi:hypothetical protein